MNEKKKPKLKRSYLVLLILLLVSVVGLRISQQFPSTSIIELKGRELKVLVAKTPEQKFKGLSGRDSLGDKDGMLFLFTDSSRHGIVMRDMRFSLDVVWIDDGEVVDIASNLPLQSGVPEEELRVYFPRVQSRVILELPAGWAQQHKLRIGDKITVVDS